MASISFTQGNGETEAPSSTPIVPTIPHFNTEEEFYEFLRNETNPNDDGIEVAEDDEPAISNDDVIEVAEDDEPAISNDDGGLTPDQICQEVIFEDVLNEQVFFGEFQNTNAIVSAHGDMWRGGHSNDIVTLAIGSKEEKVSYITGLLVPAIIVLVIFLVWMINLFILKILGPEKVGFLSGRRVKLPPMPCESANLGQRESVESEQIKEEPANSLEWDALYKRKKREGFWMKLVVIISCIIVISMSIIMAQKGIDSLGKSIDDVRETIKYSSNLLARAEDTVLELSNGIQDFQTDTLDVLERSNTGLCPTLRPKGFCQNVLDLEGCDFTVNIDFEKNITIDKIGVNATVDVEYSYYVDPSKLTDSIKDKIESDGRLNLLEIIFPGNLDLYSRTINFFSSDWAFVDKMNDFASTLNSMIAFADDLNAQIEGVKWILMIAIGFDIAMGILAVCIIVDVLFCEKLPRFMKCIQRRLLFPLFIFFVILAFIFAMVFIIASMALSDFCIDGPSQRVVEVAEYYMGDRPAAEYVLEFLMHWLSKCLAPPVSIANDRASLDEAQTILTEFQTAMLGITDSVTDFCGTEDTSLFADMASTTASAACVMTGVILDIRDIFKCSTWTPLYYNTMHNAVCYNAISGFWIIAATQFTTVLMACIILTFRAVFLEVEIEQVDNVVRNEAGKEDEIKEVV